MAALAGGPSSGRNDAAGFVLWEPVAKPAEFFRQQLRTLLFSQVAGGKKPDATVDQLLARLSSEGSVDVFGYSLQRTLVESFGQAGLIEALAGEHAPVCVAQVQPRARLAPSHVQLAEALQGAARVATAAVQRRAGLPVDVQSGVAIGRTHAHHRGVARCPGVRPRPNSSARARSSR